MLLNKLLRNSGFTLSGQIINLLLGLFFAGMTIRYLGTSLAGFFLLASSILGWAQIAGAGSFYAPAVQKLTILLKENRWLDAKGLVKTVLSANLIIALPFAIGSIMAFPFLFSWSKLDLVFHHEAFWVVMFIAMAFMIDQWSVSLRVVYEASLRFDLINYLLIIFGLIGNLIRLFILFRYKDMALLALVNLGVSVFRLIIDMVLVNRLVKSCYLPGWEKGVLRPLFSFGLWSWLTNLHNVLFFNISNLVLVKYLGSSSLPYITLPQNIVIQIGNLIMSTSYIIFPTLAGQGADVRFDIARIQDRLRWFIAVISIGVYFGLFFIGPTLLSFLVDKNFSELATLPLLFYCIYGIAWTMTLVLFFSTMAMGKAHINALTEITVGILTFVSTILFIPSFGLIGICIAQLWKLPGAFFHTILCQKLIGINDSFLKIWQPYVSPIVGAIIWTSIVYGVKFFFPDLVIVNLMVIVFSSFVFVITIWFIETKFFAYKERWSTVYRAIGLIKSKMIKSV